jgi:hypothetical protein
MKRVDYNGNQLRIDGYYYYDQQKPESTRVLFLYKSGVMLSTRFFPSHDLDAVEKTILNVYDKTGKGKTDWGLFMIVDNIIECEEWTNPAGSITIRKSIGYIENDTTFRIT